MKALTICQWCVNRRINILVNGDPEPSEKTSMDRYAFEQAIKVHLKAAGRSQAAMARRLGYAPDTFNKWVRGINRMPDDVINRLGRELALSTAEIITLLRLAGYTIPTHQPARAPIATTQATVSGADRSTPTRFPDFTPYLQTVRDQFARWADLPPDAPPLYPLGNDDPLAQDVFLALRAQTLPMRVAEFRPMLATAQPQPEALLTALTQTKRHVILGAPGSGKTSALERLAWLFAVQALVQQAQPLPQPPDPLPLPLFLRLADYHGEADLIPLLRRAFNQSGTLNVTDETVRDWLHDPALAPVLLLDGLNEFDREVQAQGIKVIRLHLADHPRQAIYLTCRIADFDAHFQTPRALPTTFRVWEIHPLLDEIETWDDRNGMSDLRHYLRCHLGDARGRQLYTRLRSDERLHSLARIPLFLWMIKETGGLAGDLPPDRGHLIRQFLRGRRLLGAIPKPIRAAAEQALAAIGWAMHQQGTLDLSLRHLYAILAEARGERGYDLEEMWLWLQRAGLLLEPESGQVRMVHQLVQEYCAATTLTERPDCATALVTYGRQVWWREVVILALWLRPDLHTPAYLQSLMTDPSVDFWVRAEAGALLAHSGDPRFPLQTEQTTAALAGATAKECQWIEPPLRTIPGGLAWLGSDEADAFDTEAPVCQVPVAPFAIGIYPVTNAEFACFVAAGGYEDAQWWLPAGREWLQGASQLDALTKEFFLRFHVKLRAGVDELLKAWQADGESVPEADEKIYYWLSGLSQEEYLQVRTEMFLQARRQPNDWSNPLYRVANAPVIGVNWYEAMAYATWLATVTGRPYRLPTEAEWEWAAHRRTGSVTRRYPWGNEWDPQRCNGSELHYGRPCSVGLFPHGATPDGLHDLAGNVYEWTATIFRPYPYTLEDGREDRLAIGPRVCRGGAWPVSAHHNRCTMRSYPMPIFQNERTGFRIACDQATFL